MTSKRQFKKVLSTILATTLVFSATPSTSFAEEPENNFEDIISDVTQTEDETETNESDYLDTSEEELSSIHIEAADIPIEASVDDIVSPIVEGNSVTFIYQDDSASKVSVAGSMNSWTANQDMMSKNSDGNWELTFNNLSAGAYEYKFVVGDSGWTTDPSNQNESSGNSAFWIGGLANYDTNATLSGKITTLPETLKLWSIGSDKIGYLSDAIVTYSLSSETADKDYADKINLNKNAQGYYELSLSSDFPSEVSDFTLMATDESGNYSSEVTVDIVAASYTYTIYYYDTNHNSTDNAALWIWNTNGAGASEPTYFSSTETLSDGNLWLKATVTESYKDISIIPRAHDSWEWQDDTRAFVNTEGDEDVTLYIVYGDGSNIYTSLPEIKTSQSRYLVVEYARNDGSAKNWYFYTWNNGYSGFYPFEQEGDKWIARIPVKDGLSSVSYCIERADVSGDNVEHWAQKDGNDYLCAMPEEQNIVKIQMTQDLGITYTFPYNKGYEISPSDDKIHFYFRDDDAFVLGDNGGYDYVAVEINGTEYPMNFDEDTQRYIFDLVGVAAGTYNYRYVLRENTGADTIYVTDKFNSDNVTVDGIEYSVCQYDAFDITVCASLQNPTMDYNDNNVLSVKLMSDNEDIELSNFVVSSATADLTELGGGITPIEPEIMELAISVKEGTSTGEKTIPIVVYDQYKNEYKTYVKVTVTNRDKKDDFDWDEAVIYFTVTDRFFDGNSSNNGAGYDTSSEMGSLSYHGGDFAGLTQKLDYLQDLGVNTIWITPIVANDMEDGLSTSLEGVKSWGYHGYWASDFTKLDSHLGTEEEFATLIEAVHERGMKIMVDVVLNHAGYNTEDYFNSLLDEPMIRDDSQTVSGSDQQSSLSGLPDFLTENEEVRELLVAWQSQWISKYPIDYYRVDTVKHVDDATWTEFKNALTKINPDFKLIGEWSGAGYGNVSDLLGKGRMDSLLDFDFNDKAVAFVKGDITGTEDFLNKRNQSINNTATLGAFIGSHDEDGFVYKLINDEGIDTKTAKQLQKVAASLQLTVKGQVVIYYGEEIGLYGADNYPYQTNRYDFDWSIANDDNEMLVHYKKLLSIRSKYSEVLAKGTRTTIEASNDKGLDIFERSYNGTTLTIGLNVTENAQDYSFSGLTPNTNYIELYSDTTYITDSTGSVTITIPASQNGGTVILAEGKNENISKVPSTGIISDDDITSSESTLIENDTTEVVSENTQAIEPTYQTINGTTVIGWENVINTAISEKNNNADNLQYLYGSIGSGGIIDITLPSDNVKPIPNKVVSIMAQSNAIYRFILGNKIVCIYTPSALGEVIGDLNLNLKVSMAKDFGQGFKSIVIEPRKKMVYGAKLSFALYLGVENGGKPAYIFHRNTDTNDMEFLEAKFINENGTVTISNEDYTDLIILY